MYTLLTYICVQQAEKWQSAPAVQPGKAQSVQLSERRGHTVLLAQAELAGPGYIPVAD